MSKFKIILIMDDGDRVMQDEEFDTAEEAEDYACYLQSCDREGAEILHMSNPGDYEYDPDTFEPVEYEIVEVDD